MEKPISLHNSVASRKIKVVRKDAVNAVTVNAVDSVETINNCLTD
jgi:hypothetical protein